MPVATMPGCVGDVLPPGLRFIDREAGVFEAMLRGWRLQQKARSLRPDTMDDRERLVKRFAGFTNQYPWQWTAGEWEEFVSSLGNGRVLAASTMRGYAVAMRLFMEYVSVQGYGWQAVCLEQFGDFPVQLISEWNAPAHLAEFEGRPGRRPLTYDEVQALFDAVDGRVQRVRDLGRKGALAALRDSAMLKFIYAFGLRRAEARGMDISDLRHNPRVAQYRRCGAVFVRYGKAKAGSAPKRRTVLTVPEFDWIVEDVEHYLEQVRPALCTDRHPALWVNERCGRISLRSINLAFVTARRDAGLDEGLELHCLRHSYVTHLVEFGYPERFVTEQVGHESSSTTAIYTGVSDEFRNRLLERSLRGHGELWSVS